MGNTILNYITPRIDIDSFFLSNFLYLDIKDTVSTVKNLDNNSYQIDDFIFSKYDKIPYTFKVGSLKYKTYYQANNIMYNVELSNFMINEEFINDCYIFIFPLIAYNLIDKSINNAYYINTYIDNNFIYIKYRFTPFTLFTKLDTQLRSTHNFKEVFFSKDKRFKIYKFNIPYRFRKSVLDYFINGLFHKMSNSAKDYIEKYNNFTSKDYYWKILHNDSDLRKKMELEFNTPIPETIGLRNKPTKKDILWKYNKNL